MSAKKPPPLPNLGRSVLLRVGGRDIPLRKGRAYLGRHSACDVVLHGGTISRRHARVTAGKDGVVIEDLSSQLGVLVNGGKIDGQRMLQHGDLIRIGTNDVQVLFVEADEGSEPDEDPTWLNLDVAAILAADQAGQGQLAEPESGPPTERGGFFEMIAPSIDDFFARHAAPEAERTLSGALTDALRAARAGELRSEERDRAALYASRLAGATGKGEWIDLAIQLYAVAAKPPPATVVDAFEAVWDDVDLPNLVALRGFLRTLGSMRERFDSEQLSVIGRVSALTRRGWD